MTQSQWKGGRNSLMMTLKMLLVELLEEELLINMVIIMDGEPGNLKIITSFRLD